MAPKVARSPVRTRSRGRDDQVGLIGGSRFANLGEERTGGKDHQDDENQVEINRNEREKDSVNDRAEKGTYEANSKNSEKEALMEFLGAALENEDFLREMKELRARKDYSRRGERERERDRVSETGSIRTSNVSNVSKSEGQLKQRDTRSADRIFENEPVLSQASQFKRFEERVTAYFKLKKWSDHLIRNHDPEDLEDKYDDVDTAEEKSLRREQRKTDEETSIFMLKSKLDAKTYELVSSLDSTYQVWQRLKDIFKKASMAAGINAEGKLNTLKLNSVTKFVEHISSMETLRAQAQSGGRKVDDDQMIGYLIRSIDSVKEFETTVESILTQQDRKEDGLLPNFSFNDACRMLIRRADGVIERNIASRVAPSMTKSVSMATSSIQNQGYGSKPRNQPRQQGQQRPQMRTCYKCGKMGYHIAKDCRYMGPSEGAPRRQSPQRRVYSGNEKMLMTGKKGEKAESHIFLDSCATGHVFRSKAAFIEYEEDFGSIQSSNKDSTFTYQGRGKVRLVVRRSDGTPLNVVLSDVMHAPKMLEDIVSMTALQAKGCTLESTVEHVIVRCEDGDELFYVDSDLGMWKINGQIVYPKGRMPESVMATRMVSANTLTRWHHRLGHISGQKILAMQSSEIEINAKDSDEVCEPCIHGKAKRTTLHRRSEGRTTGVLEMVHIDCVGKLQTPALGGEVYLFTVVDNNSRAVFVFLMHRKSEMYDNMVSLTTWAERQTGKRLKRIRSDNDGVFNNAEKFQAWVTEHQIEMSTSPPETPELNSVVEIIQWHLMGMTRAMLDHSGLAERFWGEAVKTAAHIRNRIVGTKNGKQHPPPLEVFLGQKASLKMMKPFGCAAYAVLSKDSRKRAGKLASRTRDCIMLGYESQGYKLMEIESGKIIRSATVYFDETKFPKKRVKEKEQQEEKQEEKEEEEQEEEKEEEEQEEEKEEEEQEEEKEDDDDNNEKLGVKIDEEVQRQAVQARRYSTRIRRPPERWQPGQAQVLMTTSAETVPKNYHEAIKTEYRQDWINAYKKEIEKVKRMSTYRIEQVPPGQKVIKTTWAHAIKRHPDGTVKERRARWCVQGFRETAGIDFESTYAPTPSFAGFRIVITLAAIMGLVLYKYDVVGAFLNAVMTRTVYVWPPPGFEGHIQPGEALRLLKALYGTQDGPKLWNGEYNSTMTKKLGYFRNDTELCLYHKGRIDQKDFKCSLTHVDDGAMAASTEEQALSEIRKLAEIYEITWGSMDEFLGIEVIRKEDGSIWLSQENFIRRVLLRFEMEECNATATPMTTDFQTKMNENEMKGKKLDMKEHELYRSMIGSIIEPFELHLSGAKRLLRYLKGTVDWFLEVKKEKGNMDEMDVMGYSDSDFASDTSDRKSMGGYVIYLGGTAIIWKGKKSASVATSTAEAEYQALYGAACDLVWVQKTITGMALKVKTPMILFCDNEAAIKIGEGDQVKTRLKHIDVKLHKIRELVRDGIIKLMRVTSIENVADIFTKPLPQAAHERCCIKMGLKSKKS